MYLLGRTLPKKSNSALKKAKSYDDLNHTCELTLNEIKILLCCDHSAQQHQQLSHRIQKQQILERNRLFDPSKMFGGSRSGSVEQSMRKNSSRLNSMFESTPGSRNNSCSKKTPKKQSLIMGKTLNKYLRENKQNYQKNGPNHIQKLRIKLKISKQMP